MLGFRSHRIAVPISFSVALAILTSASIADRQAKGNFETGDTSAWSSTIGGM